jgi:hypothetical protein
MDLLCVGITAWSPCPSCRTAIPLNCITDGTQCPSCGKAFATPPDYWQKALQDALAQAIGRGDGHTVSHMVFGHGGDPIGVIEATRTDPRCHPACNAVLPIGDFVQAAQGSGWARCFQCGGWLPSRPAFDWLRQVVPSARAIVSEIPPGQQAPQPGPHRWYVLLESSATDTIPSDAREFCGFVPSPQGHLIVAYHEDRRGQGSPFVIAAFATRDGTSRVVWENRQLEFSDESYLLSNPGDGSCTLVDPKANFLAVFDPSTGAPLRMLRGEPVERVIEHEDDAVLPEPRPIRVYDVPRGVVAVDVDGSYLIQTNWHDGKWSSLRRFASNGAPMPLWTPGGPGAPQPAKKKGGLGALFGGGKKDDDDDAFDNRDDWDKLKDCPEKLPNGHIHLHVGYDGVLWILDDEKFVRYARDGRLIGRGVIPKFVDNIYEVTADRSGALYASIGHKVESRGRSQNFLKLMPDGSAQTWLGPQAQPGGAFTSEYDRHVKAMPDGTLFVGRGFESLRMIGPDRRALWTAPITVTKDREEQARF